MIQSMIPILLLILHCNSKTTDGRDQLSQNYPFGMRNQNTKFNEYFSSAVDSYQIQQFAESGVFNANQENYVREKCKTCCRVIFASDYNYKTEKQFTDEDDKNETPRYVMDMEFDDKRSVRYPDGNYEQNVLLRPLKQGNELQFFEFAPYRMYTYAPGTRNQRFVYVHPYPDSWYPEYHTVIKYRNSRGALVDKKLEWPTYKRHFYLPYRLDVDLCYQAKSAADIPSKWYGNRHLNTIGDSYQITASVCNAKEPRQIFIPVFA
ncbi:galactose-inhibitable lectin 35 kda subunit precursor [Entamoeba histolytica]|uniref:Galactose-inhibitable lectin 35 kDa subunit, putative n=3 Tax=Entamoeba histolytica TaxID=5759 RepID=B1N419_ENTH1|nr:galactose-inhibitable lectin 35 kDa subunit precursor, putative [Entamoeba histolytica HM-1:IMSS]EDS89289.1 galactose-inhibitable lectin 35 kDa subunit precursor, putative [Entamoeba histolytica HM-1:IMSS]EMD46139.1 galactoseinhibitable lectin 35 kDa subunit precursor, putative [Entamoeba histolytica KU27]GAT97311.1 galactose-inhibitable lectin 35 kda subunit precursor [Entamoeba histolytica]|eukprot:XP_001913935.1 galactose-inhibitable lectin 35 kDa subunit precursor, putative [Entamoeba histolytica HM-1:IMSS]